MKVQIKIQMQTQVQIQADEKSWRWPQSGNELNEPAGEQWRPLGADLATGFASTIARIKIHKQIQNNFAKNMFQNTQTNTKYFCEEYVSKYANKYKIHLQRKYVLKYTSKKIEKKKLFKIYNVQSAKTKYRIFLQRSVAKIKTQNEQNTHKIAYIPKCKK